MHVGIVGAGFSGCMLAVHLLRRAPAGLAISLIESAPEVGRGAAYGVDSIGHLLNVRAANMSAFADDPSHFLRWLWRKESEETLAAPALTPADAFVMRRTYGEYIAAILRDATEAPGAGSKISIVKQAAVELRPGAPAVVTLADGSRLDCDRVALCLGNFPAAPLPGVDADARASGKYLNDRRHWSAFRRIQPEDDVLILGSGPTMADAIQSLLEQRHRGGLHVISRHGLLPLRHEPARAYALAALSGSALDLLVQLRREATRVARDGYDWRDVVDAFRPAVRDVWQSWPVSERRRFLRHARPYWEIHRHRLAPAVADEIAMLMREKRLKITAGDIEAVSWRDGRFDLTYRPRGAARRCAAQAAWVINCTGPQSDYRNIPDALVQKAVDTGVIRPDPLNLGIDVTLENRVVGADGRASSNIFTLGPPTKGIFWEVTAVPDIRGECERVAELLIAGR